MARTILLIFFFFSDFSHRPGGGGRRNGFRFLSSTVCCPIPPPPLTPHYPYLLHLYPKLFTCFSVFLSISFLVHLPFFLARAILLTCPHHFSIFSVIFFVTGVTLIDSLTCSFLILPFFVTPQIHSAILLRIFPIAHEML